MLIVTVNTYDLKYESSFNRSKWNGNGSGLAYSYFDRLWNLNGYGNSYEGLSGDGGKDDIEDGEGDGGGFLC